MHPGNSGISCCHYDTDWCCLWTWGTSMFELSFKEHLDTGKSIALFDIVRSGITSSLVLRTYITKLTIWCANQGVLNTDGTVCVLFVFISTLSFCRRVSEVLVSIEDFYYNVFFFNRILKYFDFLNVEENRAFHSDPVNVCVFVTLACDI